MCSDILRRCCITLEFKFSPNAQPMHNLCSYHQKVVALQTKEVSTSFFFSSFFSLLKVFTHQQSQSWMSFYSDRSDTDTCAWEHFRRFESGLRCFAIYVPSDLLVARFKFMVSFVLQLISHPCIIRAVQRSTDTQVVFWALLILCFWLSVLRAEPPCIS